MTPILTSSCTQFRSLAIYTQRRSITTSSSSVPGLVFISRFLDEKQIKTVQSAAVELHRKLILTDQKERAKSYLSQSHNLKSDESYRNIRLVDESRRKISCQHFEKYGEEGHKLTYFIGNANIPTFIQKELIARVSAISEVRNLKPEIGNWNFTLNTYALTGRSNRSSTLAGFPYHVDVKSNGDFTAIYSLGADSIFEIRNPLQPDLVTKFTLANNSLVLLSGAARWIYEHRVVPTVIDKLSKRNLTGDDSDMEAIRRISLVVGVQLKNREDFT